MAEQDISDLVEKVGDLTSATTELLGEVNVSKTKLDNAEKTATESAASAKTDAATATTKAAEAKTSEQNAKKSADSAAKVVTGGTATLDPEGGKIPLADAKGKIHHGWLPDQSIPFPDFWLPLNDSLQILAGEGKHDQIDVSAAQDGSKMIDLPTKSAEFSRATTATYVDKSGVLRTAGINEPRFEKEGILIEGSSTNFSTKLSNPEASKDVTVEDGTNIGLMQLHKKTSGAFGEWFRLGKTPNGGWSEYKGKTVTVSIFARRGSSVSDYIEFHFFSRGSDPLSKYNVEPSYTRIYWDNSKNDSYHNSESISADLYRLSKTITIPDDASEFNSQDAHVHIDIGAEVSYEVQFEELPFASSYIPTDGSPVTRNSDNAVFDSSRIFNPNSDYTITFCASGKVHGKNYQYFLGNNTGNRFVFRSDSEERKIVIFVMGGDGDVGRDLIFYLPEGMTTTAYNRYTLVKINDTYSLYANGTYVGKNTYSAFFDEGFKKIGIGRGTLYNNTEIHGFIRDLRIWGKALSNTQIAALGAAK